MSNPFAPDKADIKFASGRIVLFLILFGVGAALILIPEFFQPWTKHSGQPAYFSAKGGDSVERYGRIQKPCNFSSPEFSDLPFPIENITDCVQVHRDVWKETYVKDDAGTIWMWTDSLFSRRIIPYYLLFAVLFFGAIYLLLLAIWYVGKRVFSFFKQF